MKKAFLMIVVVLFTTATFAQSIKDTVKQTKKEVKQIQIFRSEPNDEVKTLLGDIKSIGGYFSMHVRYDQIDKSDGIVLGGSCMLLLNHSLGVGFAGSGFFNAPAENPLLDNLNYKYDLSGGYGGILFEPIIWAKFPVHISFPILIGAGGISYGQNMMDVGYNYNNNNNYNHRISIDNAAFFVFEPGVELELNVVKYFRIGLGVNYRYTSKFSLEGNPVSTSNLTKVRLADQSAINNISFGLSMKFGLF